MDLLSSRIDKAYLGESYGGGVGIVGGCVEEWGTEEGGADRVIRNRSMNGLAVSVAFKSIACPFLYTVKVRLSPKDLC
jgi:hypothetical protein